MIDFGVKQEDKYMDAIIVGAESSEEKKDEMCYPRLHVSGIKGDDGLEIGEWTEVVAKVKKCSKTVTEGPGGEKTYSCEYKVKGFAPLKQKETNFGEALEKMMEE